MSVVGGESVSDKAAPLSVKQAAQRLGRTEWWTRNYFKNVAGTLVMPGSGKRGRRKYETVTIPIDVFEREWMKFCVTR